MVNFLLGEMVTPRLKTVRCYSDISRSAGMLRSPVATMDERQVGLVIGGIMRSDGYDADACVFWCGGVHWIPTRFLRCVQEDCDG